MADRFDTTRWSLILHAGGEGDGAQGALETLCRNYRPPVLAYIRARPYLRDDAEDLAQSFFTYLLEQRLVARADRERGRFRAFLLTSLKYFLANEYERATAQRRGGGSTSVPLDEIDPAVDSGPEQAFEREWAQTVVRLALSRLEDEAVQAGKQALFARLRPFLLHLPEDDEYEVVATALGLRRNTVAVAVHRLRARLQELVRAVIADSADGLTDTDAELRHLRTALDRNSTATHGLAPDRNRIAG